MKKIVTHVILNNKTDVSGLLKSISYPENEIYIITSQDIKIPNVKIYKTNKENKDEIRNDFVSNSPCEWHLYFEPHETLNSGWNNILNATQNVDCYNFYVTQDKFITKSTRLFNKKLNNKFVNPVFEYLDCKNPKVLDVVIKSSSVKLDNLSKINDWINLNPLNSVPYYYKAVYYLSENNYKEFLRCSDNYLFHQKKVNIPFIMTKYYRSLIFLISKEYKKAIDEIQFCIKNKPDMAEFWCLLGDIMTSVREYKKAEEFYNKALIEGKKRDIKDEYPIIPKMYKEYPVEQIAKCEKALNEIKSYYLS